MNKLVAWWNHRTGLDETMHDALYENVPSGARWRYVSGSMLVFAFVTQVVTGIFLWMSYSPSSQTAWESVYYIQHEMTGGWLLRGIHHFMAQAMVVLLGVHLLQVVVDGAYKAPREVNYWLGLILMQIVLGLGLTGYLLPWDQKGYWATNVATNLMTLVPFVGKELQQVVLGGSDYGHHTLTRFFALHAGVLPALMVIFLAMHIAVFRRHGITAKITPGRSDQTFWPHQVLLDAVACLFLLVLVVLATVHFDVQGLASGNLPIEHRGAELGAPADPSEQYSAARPEWYFLFLFQLLKYFHGESEWIGALAIPGAIMGILFLLPFFGRTKIGHAFSVLFILGLLAGAGVLTVLAWSEDNFTLVAERLKLDPEAPENAKKLRAAEEFAIAKEAAHADAQRMIELVNRRMVKEDGELSDRLLIQKQGAVYLLRNDPLTQGPKLFARHCASCHDYFDPNAKEGDKQRWHFANQIQLPKTVEGKNEVLRDSEGNVVYDDTPNGAPNLFGFASRQWLTGLLNPEQYKKIEYGEPILAKDSEIARQKNHPANFGRPIKAPYFGNTAHRDGRMAAWFEKHIGKMEPQEVQDVVVALSAQAKLRSQLELDKKDAEQIARGVTVIKQTCAKGCHRFGDAGQLGVAPDLTGYGSYEWMMGMISDPESERFYRSENDRMPCFAQDLNHPERHTVSIRELSLIVDWLRGDYYDPQDDKPVLPHSEEFARRTTELARTLELPPLTVQGSAAPSEPTQVQRAEALFATNCAACHNHVDKQGRGIVAKQPSAPNLHGFGSRDWLAGFLDHERIGTAEFFGNTAHAQGDMVGFVEDELSDLDDETKASLTALVAALSAEAALPAQKQLDDEAKESGLLEKGREALVSGLGGSACTDCHMFGDEGTEDAPDLTGWASQDWLTAFLNNPADSRFYGKNNDRMPAFHKPERGERNLLTAEEVVLLSQWLRGELTE